MTTYYVGPGGNDSNDGLTWANRFLTLNGVEDEPVAPGDIVWVGPGVYREQLTIDVDGESGNWITYYADTMGDYTDGIGGIVRITGSDNDTSATRTYTILGETKDYRRFRGFYCDLTTQEVVRFIHCENIILEDIIFGARDETSNDATIHFTGVDQGTCTIQRCFFFPSGHAHIDFYAGSDISDLNHVVQDCIFMGSQIGVLVNNVGGIDIRNSTFLGNDSGVRVDLAPASGQTIEVYNSIFVGCNIALYGFDPYLVEDYNSFYANTTDRSGPSTGSNSNNYPPIFEPPILRGGLLLPWVPFVPSEWSPIRQIAGTAESGSDIFGTTRPVTSGKKSWGAVQYDPVTRATSPTVSSPTSIELSDAGNARFIVPNSGNQTVVTVQVYREANYAGTLPQLRVVEDGGYATNQDTDTGSVSTWNELSIDSGGGGFDGNFIQIELGSHNSATSGSYAVYFDDLTITSP